MTGKVRHLLLRAGRYSARLAVPHELRPIIGKRELLEPLGADRAVALRKHPAAVARMQATLEAARAQLARDKAATRRPRPGRPLSVREIAHAHFEEVIRDDEEFRNSNSSYASVPINDAYVAALRRAIAGSASNDELYETVGAIVRRLESGGQTAGRPGSSEWRELARGVAVAELEALRVVAGRDEGEFNVKPEHPLIADKPTPQAATTSTRIIGPDSTKPLSTLVSMIQEEKGAKPGTRYEYEVAARMFEEFLEEARPAHAITRQDVLAYKRALLETPANYTKRFRGLTLPDAIKANKLRASPFPTLSTTTINDKWLPRLHSILKWAVNNNVIPDNPATGVKVERAAGRTEKTRVPFTPGDLAKIFAPPLFAPDIPLGERQWALLVALFSGMRASEIAQMKLDSVRHERGILVFAIEESTKTRSSVRLVPVHST